MGILDKIEEIRHQPEHIRLRWAWGFTAIGMIVVLIIWAISFSAQMRVSEEKEELKDKNSDILEELDSQKKSIEDTTKQMKDLLGSQPQNNNVNNQ